MVKVDQKTTDLGAGWRIRDALAAHPLLGGPTADIHILAHYDGVVLSGWALDERVLRLAIQLARRAAGKRTIQPCLRTDRFC